MKKIIAILIISNNFLSAQTLDNNFGTNGQTILNTNVNQKSSELLRDIALQSNGKTIYVSDSQISRFDAFDVLDNSFGSCGLINISGGRKIASLSDNSFILMATNPQVTGVLVYKFNSNGILDLNFGEQGVTNITTPNIDIWDLKITLDNKIILGGTLNNDFLVIRLNSNGTFDNTFDFDGICTYDLGTTTDRGMILKVQQDNKVLLVGTSKNPDASLSNRVFAGIRINNNGSLDISFGTGGILRTILVNQSLVPSDLILENDGSFTIFGTTTGLSAKIVLAKYSNIGLIDNSFGNNNNGVWLSEFNTIQNQEFSLRIDKITAKKIQSDYYLSFPSRNPTIKKYGIAKITPTVNNNTTNISAIYQEYSLPPTTYSNTNSSYINYLFNENNQLVLGGYASNASSINDIIKLKFNLNLQFSSLSVLNSKQISKRFNGVFEIDNENFITWKYHSTSARFNEFAKILPNGTKDLTFSNQGSLQVNSSYIIKVSNVVNNSFYINDLSNLGGQSINTLSKYNINGDIELNFGNNGFVNLLDYDQNLLQVRKIIYTPNNGIYVLYTGSSLNSLYSGIININEHGSIISTFGVNGLVNFSYGINNQEISHDMFATTSGLFVFIRTGVGYNTLTLRKIDFQGNLVNNFGNQGQVNFVDNNVFSFSLNPDIKLYQGFFLRLSNKIVKINLEGQIDTSFANNGYLNENVINVNDFIVNSCNDIYLAGSLNDQSIIKKYNLSGVPDSTFGSNGSFNIQINCASSIRKIVTGINSFYTFSDSWNGNIDQLHIHKYLDNSFINTPTANSTQSFNSGDTLANLSVSGTNLQWYSNSTGGTPLPLSTVLVDGATYYVSQTVNGCESERIAITVTISLNTDDFILDSFKIYPNPTSSILNFKSVLAVETIAIYNTLGQLVQQEKVNALEGAINIEKLAQGTYLVKVNDIAKGYTIIKN